MAISAFLLALGLALVAFSLRGRPGEVTVGLVYGAALMVVGGLRLALGRGR